MAEIVVNFIPPKGVQRLLELRSEQLISPKAFVVGVAISTHGDRGGRCFLLRQTIGRESGYSVRAVSRALRELEESGYLRTDQRNGKGSEYQLNLDSSASIEEPTPVSSGKGSNGTPARMDKGACQNGQGTLVRAGRHKKVLKKVPKEDSSCPNSGESDNALSLEALELCETLKSEMLARDPKAKVPKSFNSRKGWGAAARLLLESDGRPFEEAHGVLLWSQNDGFWQDNIQSLPKFREKYQGLRGKYLKTNPAPAMTQKQLDMAEQIEQEMRNA